MAEIHSISLNKEQSEFVKSQTELSLSKVTQSALREIMERHKIVYNDLEVLQRKINKLQSSLNATTKFIEDNNLWEKFVKNTDYGGLI